jgi:hypothetical protein
MSNNVKGLRDTFAGYQSLQIDSYLKSLPYFLLTGRKGFYFFRNDETSLSVAIHPHKENTLVVFPEYGGKGDLTLDVLTEFSRTGFDVQLARYTEKDYENLQGALARAKQEVIQSISIKEEDLLDWRYPTRILDTAAVADLQGKKFEKIRNKFNKVAQNSDYQVIPLVHHEAEKVIRATIFHWLGCLAYVGRHTGEDVSGFYHALLENISQHPLLFDGFAIKTDREAVGFTVWDVTGNTANALAGLTQRNIPGMSEFQTVTACRILDDQGVNFYNLGGSETASLDQYKLKFHPVESIKMFSCDVEFSTNKAMPFQYLNVLNDDKLQL